MTNTAAIEIVNVSKYFGDVIANKGINLTVNKGEILALLGENGSGKTTLMNMLSGIYFPDEGQIFVDGKEVVIKSPKDAFDLKIGMVHQHFKLVDVFSAVDNILLGINVEYSIKNEYKKLEESCSKNKFVFFMKTLALPFKKIYNKWFIQKSRGQGIQFIADKYGFEIDLNKKIYDMSVSEKQTVEIIKTLYRGADVLILDEPTAVLTPQETNKLFDVLRRMKQDGKSIIIITHKLNEVLEISDKVAILRKGHYIGTVNTSEATEQSLTEMMVGQKVDLEIDRFDPVNPEPRLIVKNLNCKNREGIEVLKDVSFEAQSGEILGIAGIAGSGQRELLEAIAGLQKLDNGSILYNDPKTNQTVDLKTKNPNQIREMGVRLSFVPEDRLGMGLVGNMDIIDNMMLRSYKSGKSFFFDRKEPKHLADKVVDELEVVTPSTRTPVRRLSGGNVQKVLVGREIASSPTVLMAAYPVRGLDINSSYTIYNLFNEQKKNGTAVIFVGEDLDVLLALCDKVVVLCGGSISGIVDARTTTKEEVGLLMTKNPNENKETKNKEAV